MAEETKKDEDAETVPEANATGADALETAGADVAPQGESAVPADGEDASLDPVEALIAERDSLKDQLLRALADVENMRRRTEREMETAARHKGRFVAIGEPDYPPALRAIDGAPPLLAMCGSGATATRPALGIVGARNASIAGMKFCSMIADVAASAGYTVVSGLARGIDTAAHQASLSHGTFAAIAGGLDRPYPPENIELYRRIPAEGGVVVSEMPYGWEPRARDFPRRTCAANGWVMCRIP